MLWLALNAFDANTVVLLIEGLESSHLSNLTETYQEKENILLLYNNGCHWFVNAVNVL